MIKKTRKKIKEVKPYQKIKNLLKANNKNPQNKYLCKQKKLRISPNKSKLKKVVNNKSSKLNNKGKVLKTKKWWKKEGNKFYKFKENLHKKKVKINENQQADKQRKKMEL